MLSTSREIIVPHDPDAGPVSAVRNFVLQASLAKLREHGHFDRYTRLIAPDTLEQLTAMSIAPGWVPIALALAHYEACDSLLLTREEFMAMGSAVGARIRETILVSSAQKSREADFDPWSVNAPLNRMWARLYQGGSVQVVKAGPRDKLLEHRGFQLSRCHYFRQAQAAALKSVHSATGSAKVETKVESYSPARDELVVRVSWG